MTSTLKALIRSLRPVQWLKNGFVLAPIVFSGRITDPEAWTRGLIATVAFCAASSATYLINDLLDREADRSHPEKCKRPIAAGEISPTLAIVTSIALFIFSMTLAAVIGGWFPAVVACYVVLVVLYSLVLKRAVFLDVLIVAAGFVLRVLGGIIAIDLPISRWILLVAYLLALYLALGKRRAELVTLGESAGTHRVVLGHYTMPMVDHAITVVLGATLVTYALYTMAPETVAKVGSEGLLVTVPIVLYGLFRYLYLLHRHELGGSPTKVLITDRPLLFCVVVWIIVSALVIGGAR